MKTLSSDTMLSISGGISSCDKAIIGEFLAWGSLFFAGTVVLAGLAVAGLLVAPVIVAYECQK